MRLLVAASLVLAATFAALPGAQAIDLASAPPIQVATEVPDLAAAAYCTCDPIPIVLVVLYLLTHGPCMVDAAAYDLAHSYYLNRERDDCTIDSYPSYYCVGESGSDVHREVGFVEATVRVCHPPLPPITA